MSTKTIKQRIALVAVSALTAGMFTVVSAPVANATIAAGGSHFQASSLVIGTNASTTGTPNVPTAVQLGSLLNPVALSSVGWVADTNATSGGVTGADPSGSSVSSIGTSVLGGISRTGVIQAGGKISFVATSVASAGATSAGVSVVVTGGTIGSLITTSAAISLNGSATAASVFATQIVGVNSLGGTFSVSAAAGSVVTIAAYTGTGITSVDTRSSGSLIAIWSLTVAAANTSGTVNLGESTVTQQSCITYASGNASSASNAYDTTSRCGNGRLGVVFVSLKDAYASPVTTGQLAATATNGSLVNVVAGSSTASGDNYAATTAFDTTAASSNNYVVVTQPVANVAGSTTVTITYAGTVVGTKTINFAGDVATITIMPTSATVIANGVSSLSSGTSYALNVVYQIRDAAGNAISSTPTMTGATGAMLGASLSTSTDTTISIPSSSATANTGYATINHAGGTATANFGAGSYQIQVLNGAGVAVKSNVYSVTVASQTTHTFTASFDKASYSAGDFAILTISAKDINGNPMPTGKTLPGLVISVSSGLTVAGSECSSASTFTAGSKTCTFAVGNTAGSYSWSVALTTATAQSPVTGVVKQTDTAVSNADVLKSIVALIASINKQIAALQKLILKR
jgi:hypothetical protein